MEKTGMSKNRNEEETRFAAIMRQKIYQMTNYEIEPNDPIYPILACLYLLAKGCVNIQREEDRKEWSRIESRIENALKKYYGHPGPARIKTFLVGGICAGGGIIVGIGIGLFFRMMAL